MAKFTYKKLPRYFNYSPSKSDLKTFIQSYTNILRVDFNGISYSETHYDKNERNLKERRFIHIGEVEARIFERAWVFRIKIFGHRKENTGKFLEQIRKKVLKEIKDYIAEQQCFSPMETEKPRQVTIAFDIKDNQIIMNSQRHSKPVFGNEFSSETWWK